MGRPWLLALFLCAALAWTLSAPATDSEGFVADIVVAADGSGDYISIQAAIDSIPVDNARRFVIEVREGLYQEKVRIDQDRITLRGAGRDKTIIRYNLPRTEYDRRYDRIGPAVVNVFGEDLILSDLTVHNSETTGGHAFAMYGQPQRFILDRCDVFCDGGDTLSLWNTPFGMYYHRDCRFRGGVDYVCPRGWCFVRDSQFESVNTSASIWQDGHLDLDMKFVVRDSTFDGPQDFWIGRNHYPSQFYLLGCLFTERMADKPIITVGTPKPWQDPAIYERKYFHGCHREGGDFEWLADNLAAAPGSPSPDTITPAWTFDHQWDPERTDEPQVASVETDGDTVRVYFTEAVAGINGLSLLRSDGSAAEFVAGEGTRCLDFSGGNEAAKPTSLHQEEGRLYATVATVSPRYLTSTVLPDSKPRKVIKVLLVGDSTVSTYSHTHAYQGWGWALSQFFDDRVQIENRARGGRSSKSFRDEGHWGSALETEPDYVLIQFGHNDNPGKGPERYTDPAPGGSYRANLKRYVEEARQAGATPILVSPPTRRFYLEDGQIDPNEGNAPYAEATLAVASEVGCPVIDLNAETRLLFNRLEESHSDWVQPVGDRTHFTPRGARRIALIVAAELRELEELRESVLPHELQRR